MSHKLIYSFLALGTLTIATACSSTESVDESLNDGVTVKFTARTTDSRATIIDNTTNKLTTFKVYGDMVPTASASTANPIIVFNGTDVNFSETDNAWKYDNLQYWFPNHTHSFVSFYAPNLDNISNLAYAGGKLTFNYTAPTDYKDIPDILTSVHRRQYEKSATPVSFNFGHAMARINFVAKVDPTIPNQTITINRISIKNIASRATYSLQPAPITSGKQTSDMVAPAWSISGTPTPITYTNNEPVSITTGNTAELFPIDNDNALLVIPQTVNGNIEVELEYTNGTTPKTVSGRLRSVSSVHGYTWSAGQSYSYSFTLGTDDYLIFDAPVIKGWDEDEGGNYIVVDDDNN